jgi:translation initiation factor 3 subunit B
VDSVEIKEVIHAFAWEPIGSKFAIIHGDGPNISVSFYGVKTGQRPSSLSKCLIVTHLIKIFIHILWSGWSVIIQVINMFVILCFMDTS